jgi:hypothetical protein
MTGLASALASLTAAGALAAGGALAPGADQPVPRTALVIDAPAARDGRALVDPRLRTVEADVRLPRSAAEARTDVRYFAAQGYDTVVVAGPLARAAAARATAAGDLARTRVERRPAAALSRAQPRSRATTATSASTTAGSNCVPAHLRHSASAVSALIALRYERVVVIAL